MDFDVWDVLDKGRFTEAGQKSVESDCSFLLALNKNIGPVATKVLYDMINERLDDTFKILSKIVEDNNRQ